MAGLTVLVDHVATLRDSMQAAHPDPVAAALLAELAGADGIGIHWREIHRPINERDVRLLRQSIRGRMVVHLPATSEMVGRSLEIKPERVVLMPSILDDGPVQNGFDMAVHTKTIFDIVDTLQSHGVSVGVSVVAEPEQVKSVHQTRANWVHINTGRLQAAASATNQSKELNNIIDTIKMAHRLRLHVSVGGGLDFRLIKLFSGMREIDEFSIGQSIIARSVLVGMDTAVRDMLVSIRALQA
jgi:pyridoxine 5-phosphate synthase